MIRVALTGAAGFIGTHVAEALLNAGFRVYASEHQRQLPAGLRSRVARIVPGDLQQPDVQSRLLEDADVVCHVAAYIPLRMDDLGERLRCFERNAILSHDLALAAARAEVKHFTLLSTANLYRVSDHPVDERGEIEIAPMAAPYFVSKLAAEQFVQNAFATTATVAILRITTPFGSGEPETKVVPSFLNAARRGRRLRILGSGLETLNLVAVEDLAAAVTACVAQSANGLFNISMESVSIANLAALCLRLHDRSEKEIDILGAVTARSFAAVDSSRAYALLNWQPVSLESSLRSYAKTLSSI